VPSRRPEISRDFCSVRSAGRKNTPLFVPRSVREEKFIRFLFGAVCVEKNSLVFCSAKCLGEKIQLKFFRRSPMEEKSK
jgi:hypothetical protein